MARAYASLPCARLSTGRRLAGKARTCQECCQIRFGVQHRSCAAWTGVLRRPSRDPPSGIQPPSVA